MPRMRSAPGDGDDAGDGTGDDAGDDASNSGRPKRAIDAALLEEWALYYLARYASTAENLRRVLRRRVRRRLMAEGSGDREGAAMVEPLIEALVTRCRDTG